MIALLGAIAVSLANLSPAFAQEPFTIRIDGPAEAARLSRSAAQAFEREAPGRLRVAVDANGNDVAIDRFCRGEVQLAAGSRDFSEIENAECARAGVEFADMQIARGLRLYVSTSVLARPEGAQFVQFYAANAPMLARRAGLAPAPSGADAEVLSRGARGRGDSEPSPTLAQLLDVLRAIVTRPPAGTPRGADGALEADPAEIGEGGQVTLRWRSTNAVSGVIDNGAGTAIPIERGSMVVTPRATTDYTLTLVGRDERPVVRQAHVTVWPRPDGELRVDAPEIAEGGETTLRWSSTNAVSGVIDGMGAANPIENGSLLVRPQATTDYTLTLIGRAGQQVTRQARVTIAPPPDGTLSADAPEIAEGHEATLRWTSANAISGFIDNGVGEVIPIENGSLAVTPQATTDYTLTLVGRAGQQVTRQARVTVAPPPDGTLSAAATEIGEGGATTLTWSSTNAVRGVIDNGVGAATPIAGGSRTITPARTTTYTLRLEGRAGQSVRRQTTIRVVPPPLGTLIEVDRDGAEVRLRWTATNAVRGSIDNGGGAVIALAGRGEVTVTPRATTTYTLTLFNSVGQSFTTHATVKAPQNWLLPIGALIALAIAAAIFLRPAPLDAPGPDPEQPEHPNPRITTRIVSDGRAGETLAIDEPTGFERELRFAIRADAEPEIAVVPDGSDIGSEP